MSDPNTLRILEIDGGGERGYLPLNFLNEFVQLWGISPAAIAQNFDVICGTSIGGIIAASLAIGLTPAAIMPFFTTQGPYIFSTSSVTPSVRPNIVSKAILIAGDNPFYQSYAPFANAYGYGLLQSTLQSKFTTNTLQNLQTNIIIPTYKTDTNNYVLCSNLNYPGLVGQNELISNVCLATASAPIYFPALTLTNTNPGTLSGTYVDGGIYQNNPARFGVSLAKMIKPTAKRICLLSLGTGLGEQGFDPGNPDVMDPRAEAFMRENNFQNNLKNLKLFDSIATIYGLFDIASTGGQESVAQSFLMEASYTIDQLYYYRFQPQLDLTLNTELDNTDPAILSYYQNVATTTFNNDIDNISIFLGHLTA